MTTVTLARASVSGVYNLTLRSLHSSATVSLGRLMSVLLLRSVSCSLLFRRMYIQGCTWSAIGFRERDPYVVLTSAVCSCKRASRLFSWLRLGWQLPQRAQVYIQSRCRRSSGNQGHSLPLLSPGTFQPRGVDPVPLISRFGLDGDTAFDAVAVTPPSSLRSCGQQLGL